MNWNTGDLFGAASFSIRLILNLLPHGSYTNMIKTIIQNGKRLANYITSSLTPSPWREVHIDTQRWKYIRSTTISSYIRSFKKGKKHYLNEPYLQERNVNPSYQHIQMTKWNIPKSVNLFLGIWRNSAYSLLPSASLWSCSTRGRLVTIPAQFFYPLSPQ